MQRRIIITLDVETNCDADTLERRLESFLDPAELTAQLLDDEQIIVENTHIDVHNALDRACALPLQLAKGDRVEIHAIVMGAMGGCDVARAWLKGYSFDHVEARGDVIVVHTDGPFEGAPVRMSADKVRRAQS